MASLMGVAFMLSSTAQLFAESGSTENNPDKTCTYKKKCPSCSGESGSCDDTPPEEEPVTIQVSKDEECPSDPTEVGLDDSYELSGGGGGGARSLRAGKTAAVPIKIAGGFSPNFVNPSNLKIFGTGAEVVRDADTNIRQVKGDTGFMDAVFTPETKTLELRMYKPDDIKAGKVNGLYQIKDGRTAHLVLRYVQEADNSFRRETVNNSGEFPSVKSEKTTQTVGPEPYTITHAKTYLKGEGLSAVEYRRVSNKITAILNGEPKEERFLCTVEEMGTDGQWHLVERKAGRRAIFKEEDGFVPLYECNAVNEDGTPMNPIATEKTYTYYSDPLVPASYGKVRTLRSNDGYWENKYYDANASAGLEMIRTESPWLNTAAHEPGEAPQGQIRIKSETRCNTDTGIEDITETVGGITIAKEWTEKSRADQQKVRLVRHQPHSGGDNITTTIRYRNAKDIPVHLRGREIRVYNADGSVDLFTYTLNGQDLTITKDEGYGGESGVMHGKRTVSTEDKDSGNLKDEVRYALECGQPYWVGSKTGVQFDNAGTCLKWVYDNNPDDYTEQRKDCCHVTWERERGGTEKTYTYDAHGRLVTETSKGITLTTEYKGLTTTQWKQAVGNKQRYLVKSQTKDVAGNTVEEKTLVAGGNTLTAVYIRNIINRTAETITPYGTITSSVYTADGQLLSETGMTGVTTNYTYTPLAECGGGTVMTSSDGVRNVTTKTDLVGNVVSTQRNGAFFIQTYDAAGRLLKTVLPDGETQIYTYEMNGATIQGMDLDRDGTLHLATDRINRTSTVFDPSWPENKGSWKTTQESAWAGNWIVQGTNWKTEDGTQNRRQHMGVAGYETTAYPFPADLGKSYQIMTTLPDGRQNITSYHLNGGITTSIAYIQKDANGQMVSSTEKTQDVWGHTLTSTDARLGTTLYTVDAGSGAVLSKTNPDHAVIGYAYDQYGRIAAITLPDGSQQHAAYDTKGNIVRRWGSGIYPVSYEYDAYGQIIGMRTFRVPVMDSADWPEGAEGAEGDLTTWTYDARGNNTRKTYADGTHVDFTYSPGNRLKTFTNARGILATSTYDGTGNLISVIYGGGGITPSRQYSYDQWGRQTGVETTGVASYRYHYNDAGVLAEEEITMTTPNGELARKIARTYDAYGRPTGYQLKQGETLEQELFYTYDCAGRVSGVTADGKTFSYEWLPGSNLIQQMRGPIHTVTNTWEDHRNILVYKTNVWKNKVDKEIISRYMYAMNLLGQRTAVQTEGEAFSSGSADRQWGYDVLGQLVSANTDTYAYDQIGNRISSSKEESSEVVYTSNAVNQYSLIGSDVSPSYDADGNLQSGLLPTEEGLNRSQLVFTYSADNRPVQVSRNGETVESYAYDHLGRRVCAGEKVTIYDGYNAIAEYDRNSRTLEHTYAWGADLGNDLQQLAGGVGGLLSETNYGTQIPVVSYPTYDGNGNISEYLMEENAGTVVAHYEYDAFGNILKNTGGNEYKYQFSTKSYDPISGFVYYNNRSYDPSSARWISRDPISEKGGINLYIFLDNDSINYIDYLGNIKGEVKFPIGGGDVTGSIEIGGDLPFTGKDPKPNIGGPCNNEKPGKVAEGSGIGAKCKQRCGSCMFSFFCSNKTGYALDGVAYYSCVNQRWQFLGWKTKPTCNAKCATGCDPLGEAEIENP